jgi:alpha-D-xyloside xylohydrolase
VAWEHEYLFGPSILVAPVIRPLSELGRRGGRPVMPVYLPAGEWIDHWTGREHRGPVVIERTVPLSIMPVYVRLGAEIPTRRLTRKKRGSR